MRGLVLAAALWPLAGGAWACGDALGAQAQHLEDESLQLAWRATPTPIPVGRHFVLDIVLCPRAGAAAPRDLRIDATMPEHRHGMNYRPSVTPRGQGLFRAEGLMFHMPGRWELVFEWRDAQGRSRRLARTLLVE